MQGQYHSKHEFPAMACSRIPSGPTIGNADCAAKPKLALPRGTVTRKGRVLMKSPTIESLPLPPRKPRVAPKRTSSCSRYRLNNKAHAPWSRVLRAIRFRGKSFPGRLSDRESTSDESLHANPRSPIYPTPQSLRPLAAWAPVLVRLPPRTPSFWAYPSLSRDASKTVRPPAVELHGHRRGNRISRITL